MTVNYLVYFAELCSYIMMQRFAPFKTPFCLFFINIVGLTVVI